VIFFEIFVAYDMILFVTSIKHHHEREYIRVTLAINKIIDRKSNDWTRLIQLVSTRMYVMKLKVQKHKLFNVCVKVKKVK
jgi:hypothetical protein